MPRCTYDDEVRAREIAAERQIRAAECGIVQCPSCRGTGWQRVANSETVDCAVCDGIGELSEDYAARWFEQTPR